MRDFLLWLADLWHSCWIAYHADTIARRYAAGGGFCQHSIERYTHHRLRQASLGVTR